MVGGKNFSEAQGPQNLQNRSKPRQKVSFTIVLITARQPVNEAGKRLPQKGKGRLGGVQIVRPAAQRRGIWHTVRVLERRRRLLPGAVLLKTPPQCLHPRQQAVMRVRERKQREEGEGGAATKTVTAADPYPVMIFIVRLLTAVAMTDDGIAHTNRTLPQDDLVAVSSPVSFKLVRRGRKWDKENRSSLELCPPGVDPPRSEPEAELLPPEAKSNWKRIQLHLQVLGV